MSLPAEYHAHAKRCRDKAAVASSAGSRDELLGMALRYEALAYNAADVLGALSKDGPKED
jgi:hypothetical protein